MTFYRKESFVYVLQGDYLLEFSFELVDFEVVEIAVKFITEMSVDWIKAKEIKKSTFLKYYKVAKILNPFCPDLKL